MLCPALENTAPAVLWPLCARSGCAVATVRSKWLHCVHFALEMAVLWPLCAGNGCRRGPLCARNGCAVATVCWKWLPQGATVRSKWPHCGHFAFEMVALWPLSARNGRIVATVRSKWLRSGHCALKKAASIQHSLDEFTLFDFPGTVRCPM